MVLLTQPVPRNSSIYDSKATLQNNLKGEKRFFKIVCLGLRRTRGGMESWVTSLSTLRSGRLTSYSVYSVYFRWSTRVHGPLFERSQVGGARSSFAFGAPDEKGQLMRAGSVS